MAYPNILRDSSIPTCAFAHPQKLPIFSRPCRLSFPAVANSFDTLASGQSHFPAKISFVDSLLQAKPTSQRLQRSKKNGWTPPTKTGLAWAQKPKTSTNKKRKTRGPTPPLVSTNRCPAPSDSRTRLADSTRLDGRGLGEAHRPHGVHQRLREPLLRRLGDMEGTQLFWSLKGKNSQHGDGTTKTSVGFWTKEPSCSGPRFGKNHQADGSV